MSRQSIKALDLFCAVVNYDRCIPNIPDTFPDERERWTKARDRKLARFRTVLAKVTKEEFLAGRSASGEDWERMQARALDETGRSPWGVG